MRHPFYWAGLLACLPWLLPAQAAYIVEAATASFPIEIHKKLVFVEAEVDGQRGLFLFDTGISELALHRERFAHYRSKPGKRIIDINGHSEQTERIFVTHFRWANIRRDRFEVPLMDLSRIANAIGRPVLGMIGYEVFRQVEVALDYDRKRMSLHRLDSAGRAERLAWRRPDHILRFDLQRHLPALAVALPGGEQLRVGLDSGASMHLVDRRFRRGAKAHALRLYHIRYHGALSGEKVPYYTLPELRIEDQLALIHCKLAFTSMKPLLRNGLQLDGVLGVDLFRLGRVSLNFQAGLLCIWVRENVFAQKYENLLPPVTLANREADRAARADRTQSRSNRPEER